MVLFKRGKKDFFRSTITHLKQKDRQLSGQQLVKGVQSDQKLISGLARLWHPHFRTRMVFCLSTILRRVILQGGPSKIWNLNRLQEKNLWIFFLKYGLIRKIEPFHLRMEHNVIQMTATAGLTVPHSINSIFQKIFDCLGIR